MTMFHLSAAELRGLADVLDVMTANSGTAYREVVRHVSGTLIGYLAFCPGEDHRVFVLACDTIVTEADELLREAAGGGH